MNPRNLKYFWSFSKWGWLTILIALFILILSLVAISLINYFSPFLIGSLAVGVSYTIIGIKRVLTWKVRFKHYLTLREVMERKGYFDPKLTLMVRNICDKEIIKELRKEFPAN